MIWMLFIIITAVTLNDKVIGSVGLRFGFVRDIVNRSMAGSKNCAGKGTSIYNKVSIKIVLKEESIWYDWKK